MTDEFLYRKKLFLSHFLAIVLVSGSIGSYFYQNAIDNMLGSLQARLKYSAALLSTTVDPGELDQIVLPADKVRESYKKGVTHLRELVASNPDIAFIYVMRRDGADIRFVLDSDPDSPAEPEEVYAVPVRALLEGFSKPGSDRELFTDKWGTFMSGFAPLSGGGGRYVIGIDMRADEVTNKLNALHRRCLEVDTSAGTASGQKGDELDQLAVTFGDMLNRLQQSQTDLEERVEQRTTELSLANQQLKAEMTQREKITQLLEETARTDFLTKLVNRRAMHRFLQNEIARFERTGGTFSLVLVDIDHFKNINDQFGHDIGDDVLIALSAIGGTTIARDLVLRAIANGKHVVTANKALLAEHGSEIFANAQAQGVVVAYEGAVAVSIPIIKALREGLSANRIEWIAGIINGTTNYILSEMKDKGGSFAAALADAQALGYAEADPRV